MWWDTEENANSSLFVLFVLVALGFWILNSISDCQENKPRVGQTQTNVEKCQESFNDDLYNVSRTNWNGYGIYTITPNSSDATHNIWVCSARRMAQKNGAVFHKYSDTLGGRFGTTATFFYNRFVPPGPNEQLPRDIAMRNHGYFSFWDSKDPYDSVFDDTHPDANQWVNGETGYQYINQAHMYLGIDQVRVIGRSVGQKSDIGWWWNIINVPIYQPRTDWDKVTNGPGSIQLFNTDQDRIIGR